MRTQIGVVKHKLIRKIFLLNNHVTVGYRKLHNEKFHNLYSLQNTVKVITTRRLTYGSEEKYWSEIMKGRDHYGDTGI
jgi:hypothetical protein